MRVHFVPIMVLSIVFVAMIVRGFPLPTNPENSQAVSLSDVINERATDSPPRDIALVNLLCATGLPGSEGLDVSKALSQLGSV